ncbi:MAG: polysaccharide biosynthesis/export family protein [Bacteroidota bacterium]|nr:polysaccharide biosynthesis/export family protein [Bacteroidota bacterium]
MKHIFLFLFTLILFSSCKVFKSSLMLKTPKNYNYDKLLDSLSKLDYKIAPNDVIIFKVFTNDGFKLIDLATTTTGSFRTDIDVVVESDGTVKMPLVGKFSIEGLTIREAESLFEEKYSKYYVNPYVTLRVSNKRVIVFPGNNGLARVIPLTNNYTTIMEAIASAGGIPDDGKAYKVKLIRNNEDSKKKPYVYLMDLSRIEGLADAKTKVQANDIIYVEPRYRPLSTFNKEITPLITLITSVLILYQFYRLR